MMSLESSETNAVKTSEFKGRLKVKKYLAVCFVGSFAGMAHAQSSVTLYGTIDEAFQYTSNIGGHSLYGLAGGTQQNGNRWGLKGQEDLGSGLQAIFQLENGFSINQGRSLAAGQMFGRQAYVGLASNLGGTVTLGRQYDSVVDYLSPLTATGSWGGSTFEHIFDNDNIDDSFRINNSIKYQSVDYSGLTFGGLYGFSNEAGSFSHDRAWSVGARYARGNLTAAAAYMNIDNDATVDGAVTEQPYLSARQQVAGAGVHYVLGPTTLGLVYTHTEISDRPTLPPTTLKFNNIELNAKWDVTTNVFLGALYTYTHISNSFVPDESAHSNEMGLMANYALSRRTSVYVQTVYIKTSGRGSSAVIGNSGGDSDADNQTVARIGMRTMF